MSEVNLPEVWCLPSFDNVVLNVNGARRPVSLKVREGIKGEYPYYGATGQIDTLNDFTHEGEHILIGEDGANLLSKSKDLAFIVDGQFWVNNHAHAVKCIAEMPAKFVASYINSLDLSPWVSGSAQPKLTKANLARIPMPLPPLAEQKVIADKLDTLLAQVETSKARLERIPQILKTFRQSVLAAAVSGKLTEEWRGENPKRSIIKYLEVLHEEREKLKGLKKLKKSFGPKKSPDPLIECMPEGWEWVSFEHIAENDNNALKAGPFGSALKKSDCIESGYKVYGQEQVIAGDEQLVTYFVNNEKFQQLSSCSVKSGDILISLVGTIGKVLILSESADQGIINPRLVKLSLHENISRAFIKFYLNSPLALGFFKGFSHGGTMDILNLGILKELPIALPPIEEQTQIVSRVEELFAFADRIEQKANAALERVNNLTQSILAKAFRGELTADWRAANPELISGDNSAEALLEKIKAEREALSSKKKPKKKAVKKAK